jgi:hypothetical protein
MVRQRFRRWLHHGADTVAAWVIAIAWRHGTNWTIKGDDR